MPGFFPPRRGGGACPCKAAGGFGIRPRVGLRLRGLFRRGGSLGRPEGCCAEAGKAVFTAVDSM